MLNLFERKDTLPHSDTGTELVYSSYDPAKAEQREIEKAFARLFMSDDGQKVLSHLQVITFNRALGPASSEEQLRYLEGQRSLVATILRLIDRGRKA